MSDYVLITAAYNEEKYIENTILSVINQKLKPKEWVIVNDGSLDTTAKIISKYLIQYNFIKLLNNTQKNGRDFASKAYAINIAWRNISSSDYKYIGILDADITFDPDYYQEIVNKFELNPKLGVGGGIFFDVINKKMVPIYPSPFSIRGAVQFFRRECFEKIGGLVPIKYGGEDTVTCISAKMLGYEISNFKDLIVYHHRKTGTADINIFKRRFRDGIVEYQLGYQPIFQILKCIKRSIEYPILIGSLIRFLGFFWANITRQPKAVSEDFIHFFRLEQKSRIKFFKY